MCVIYRLNQGPFSGVVERHDDGPWSGWYSYTWNAGPLGGGCARIGKSAAINGLYAAMLAYFASEQPPGRKVYLELAVDKSVESD